GKDRNDWKSREGPSGPRRDSSQSVEYPPSAVAAPDRASLLTLKRLTMPIIEIAFGAYMSSFVFISLYYHYARGSIPFLLIFAGGYFYVGFSSLYVLWKMQQEADEAIAEAEEALA